MIAIKDTVGVTAPCCCLSTDCLLSPLFQHPPTALLPTLSTSSTYTVAACCWLPDCSRPTSLLQNTGAPCIHMYVRPCAACLLLPAANYPSCAANPPPPALPPTWMS
jgi:hypothetical protein